MDPASPVPVEPGVLGLVADIHANHVALEAVLDHGRQQGVDRWLVLGDVVALGPNPGAVLDGLDRVEVVAAIAGNTERYVLTGDRPEPSFETVLADPGQLPTLVEVSATFAWTRGFLTALGRLATIEAYRPSARLTLADGSRLLAVHASMRADDGPGLTPDRPADEIRDLFPDADAELVVAGHTHHRTDRMIDGRRFVNPGSVSNHPPDVADARYSTIAADRHGLEVQHHDVIYDRTAAIDAIRASGIPGGDLLLSRYFLAR